MKLINKFLFLFTVTILLQSCVMNRNMVSPSVFLNRKIQEDKIKPLEKVLIVVDLYEIPHIQENDKIDYTLLAKKLEKVPIPTAIIIKDYKKSNPDAEIEAKTSEFKPSHIIYAKHPMIDFGENLIQHVYVDVKIMDRAINEQVWEGRFVISSILRSFALHKGIYNALENDNFIKTKPQLSDKK